MSNQSVSFTLAPEDNARLQSLCGAFDEHLTLIEKSFNLVIARQGFAFTLQTEEENHHRHCIHHGCHSTIFFWHGFVAQPGTKEGEDSCQNWQNKGWVCCAHIQPKKMTDF